VPLQLVAANLLSPALCFFFLGIAATRVRRDLAVPEQLGRALALYLLLAIGVKGGAQLRAEGISPALAAGLVAAVGLGVLLPLLAYSALRAGLRLRQVDAAAIAAHYGSVSVVTFVAATAFLAALGVSFEGFMVALLAVMEVPAILVGIALARRSEAGGMRHAVHGALTSSSVLLLVGAMAVGVLTGQRGLRDLHGFIVAPFMGALAVFLLDMGLVAARRLGDLRALGVPAVLFGLTMPLVGGAFGLLTGAGIGLSVGGTTLLAVLAAGASYVAAPAAIRQALPEANPTLYLGLSLGVTFPFNLSIGIPLYYAAARVLAG